MKDFQLDFPCVSFKEKGETAESERPGERVNWKVRFEMSGTFPLAFFADLLQKNALRHAVSAQYTSHGVPSVRNVRDCRIRCFAGVKPWH